MHDHQKIEISVQPISVSAFEPFGYALAPTPDGQRRDHPGLIENLRPSRAAINLAQVCATDYSGRDEMILTLMERHPYSTQSFFPQNVGRYLVIVGRNGPDDRPLLDTVRAFSVQGDMGITYKANIWHTGIAVLDGGRNFLMVVHEDGCQGDCEFVDVQPVTVRLLESLSDE